MSDTPTIDDMIMKLAANTMSREELLIVLRTAYAELAAANAEFSDLTNVVVDLEKQLATEREAREKAEREAVRLNKWADDTIERLLNERQTGDAYLKELTADRDELTRKLAAANAEIASVRVVLGRVYGLDWKLLPMSKVVSLMKENLALAQKDALLMHSELAAKDARIAELEADLRPKGAHDVDEFYNPAID